MPTRNPPFDSTIRVLATDLDGTFLPLGGAEHHVRSMRQLGEYFSRENRWLIFVTGRHYASVREAMRGTGAPLPRRMICDVGTSIYRPETPDGSDFVEVTAFRQHLDQITERLPLAELAPVLARLPDLRRQEDEKQRPHKLSFYTKEETLPARVQDIERTIARLEAPFSVVGSIDPFTGDGLIDVLPAGVDKAYALLWLARHEALAEDAIVFAGDSGNDMAALTCGVYAILVGNARESVREELRERMRRKGIEDRLYLASAEATSGVLEGCRWFGAIPDGASIAQRA